MSGGNVATSIERGTVRKLRIRIIPFLFLLYIVAFLDRINIGFAALTMNKELAITPRQFGLLTGVFFIGYFLFEVPSNLLLHKNWGTHLDRSNTEENRKSNRRIGSCQFFVVRICRIDTSPANTLARSRLDEFKVSAPEA